MKFSIFNKFGALNSQPVFESFVRGLQRHGQEIAEHDSNADVAVIWSVLWNGRMRPNQDIFNKFRAEGKPVVVLEVGCLARDYTWKVGVNGINRGHFDWAMNYYRSFPKQITFGPDRSTGNHIVICTQNPLSEQWRNQLHTVKWLENIINEVRKFSDLPIKVRAHPRVPLQYNLHNFKNVVLEKPSVRSNDQSFIDSLSNTKLVINHNSNPAIIAALVGVPVHVDSTSLAFDVSNSLKNINSPVFFDRESWLKKLEQTEYTNEELSNGVVIDHLLKYINTNY